MKAKLIFSYDGSKFNGFQRQSNERSVQKEIEIALQKIYGKKMKIKGSGRTDAKVHANNQVAHFDIDIKLKGIKNKLNMLVNPDIYIKKIKYVSDGFHARNSVQKKEYIYKINIGPFQSSLNNYFYQPRFKLDISLMKDASKLFLGTHDFHNFVAGERENCITTIYSITFIKIFGKLEIHFLGTGFYRYMVRNLVGALIEVGKYKIKRDVIKEMLDHPNNPKSLPTAPPEGLYLNKVWY